MLILDRETVAECLSHRDCIAALEPAMRAVSAGTTIMPLRQFMPIPETSTRFTLMPGYLSDPACFGFKAVSKAERAPDSPYGSHVGAVMVFSAAEGIPLALLDGSELTAIRTAAASALATRALARADAQRLAIIGCGLQAEHHIKALLEVRPIQQVSVWGRSRSRIERLLARLTLPAHVHVDVADSIASAVAGADIVATVTAAKTPILLGEWLQPGTHVNLVGAAVRQAAEADVETVRRARFFVDYRPSAMALAGELLDAIEQGVVTEAHIAGEIGEVLAGTVGGRTNAADITVYKSLGVAAQDLAAGWRAWSQARDRAVGVDIGWC
ncbi:MAG: ornithine cyclodeaminase family protein [Gammaproteobacteria bacterium]|jgi:ornithine cyclodeaminase|nr:ornithine cyclodeaminase family protein [Gammaproteobacteria bacterium]